MQMSRTFRHRAPFELHFSTGRKSNMRNENESLSRVLDVEGCRTVTFFEKANELRGVCVGVDCDVWYADDMWLVDLLDWRF